MANSKKSRTPVGTVKVLVPGGPPHAFPASTMATGPSGELIVAYGDGSGVHHLFAVAGWLEASIA